MQCHWSRSGAFIIVKFEHSRFLYKQHFYKQLQAETGEK